VLLHPSNGHPLINRGGNSGSEHQDNNSEHVRFSASQSTYRRVGISGGFTFKERLKILKQNHFKLPSGTFSFMKNHANSSDRFFFTVHHARYGEHPEVHWAPGAMKR
jgi:hypothetical protein